jgi:hypothetical protein
MVVVVAVQVVVVSLGRPPWSSAIAHLPTRVMPVTAIVGRVIGHDDEVAEADGDLLLTSRTQVRLARLIRLHAGDGDVTVGGRVHPSTVRRRETSTD